jgi:2-methylcitrate dehydratase
MGMHFKLGLYEHQSAGAIHGLIELLARQPRLLAGSPGDLRGIRISIYEPAYSIICDPAKRDPRNRQSADHSLVYLVGTVLRKAFETGRAGWRELMILPRDFEDTALFHPTTRHFMERIEVIHGGPEFDSKYPEGIPTCVELDHAQVGKVSSGLVMYPAGHARNREADLPSLLAHKFHTLAGMGVADTEALYRRLTNLKHKSDREIQRLYDFSLDNAWIA